MVTYLKAQGRRPAGDRPVGRRRRRRRAAAADRRARAASRRTALFRKPRRAGANARACRPAASSTTPGTSRAASSSSRSRATCGSTSAASGRSTAADRHAARTRSTPRSRPRAASSPSSATTISTSCPSAGGAERALTTGGTELKSWATAEFIAQEEMRPLDRLLVVAGRTAHRADARRPDAASTSCERFDIGAAGATVVDQRYPRAGRPNAMVDLYVADVATGAPGQGRPRRRTPTSTSRASTGRRTARRSTSSARAATRSGSTCWRSTRRPARRAVILTETSPHWIELTDDFQPLTDGDFLWSSERVGLSPPLSLRRATAR